MDGLFRKADDYYYITKCESGEYLIIGNDETKTATEEQVKNNFRKVEQSRVISKAALITIDILLLVSALLMLAGALTAKYKYWLYSAGILVDQFAFTYWLIKSKLREVIM